MKRPRHDTPEKRLLRELRERGAIPLEEAEARGRYIQRAIEVLCEQGLMAVKKDAARLTAKGIAHATQV